MYPIPYTYNWLLPIGSSSIDSTTRYCRIECVVVVTRRNRGGHAAKGRVASAPLPVWVLIIDQQATLAEMSASRPPFPSPPSNPVLPLYKPSSICFLPPIDRVTSIERCPILMGQCKRQTYQWNWLDAMHQPRVESIVQWWIEWRWSGSERAQAKKIGTHTPRLAKYKDQYGGPRCNWAIHHHRYVQSGNGECAIAAAARTFVSHEIQSVGRGRFFFSSKTRLERSNSEDGWMLFYHHRRLTTMNDAALYLSNEQVEQI